MTPIEQMRKAISGGLTAAIAAAVPAALDGSISLMEGLLIAGFAIAGWNAVYWPPNAPTATTEAAPD